MTDFLQILFFISAAVILYAYIGYGILIHLLTKLRAPFHVPPIPPNQGLPDVTMIIAAYNEVRFIEQKIENSLSIDYPGEKLKIWIVTDGSNDGTPELVKNHRGVRLFHQPERKGKIHAVNRIMKQVDSPIVVFTDANTLLNNEALKNMVRHYEDELVGGVAGEKRIYKKAQDNASGTGEGFYWRYESFLKKKDSQLHSVMGAAGELFSVRTKLFEEPPQNMIIEDFYISLKIVMNGYRFIYEPEATATETASASIGDEWKRKVRIAAGGFHAMVKLLPLLNPLRFGMISIQYISHRVLRWTLAPLSLIIAFSTSLLLAIHQLPLFVFLLAVQVLFYLIAVMGYIYRDRQISVKGFFVPFYFAIMNLSVIAGFMRYLRGNQSVVWEKTERA